MRVELVAALCLLAAAAHAADPPPPAPPPAAPPATVEHVPADATVAVLGLSVFGPDKQEVGRLVDVLVDATGAPRAGVLDVGGFMGLGNRKLAIDWSALSFRPTDKDRPLSVSMTVDQLKAAPEYRDPSRPAPVLSAPPPAPPAKPPAP